MTVPEIATLAFAGTTVVMTALYWHEVSKAAKHQQDIRFDQVERHSWDISRGVREDLSQRIDELERQVGRLDSDVTTVASQQPNRSR